MAMAAPVCVVSRSFCLSHPIDLLIKPNPALLSKTRFNVLDAKESLIFRAEVSALSFHQNRVMSDAAGSPILTMRPKVFSLHQRWTVYRGESTKEDDVIFTLKAPKFWTTKLHFDVFLTGNTDEDNCDFHVESKNSDSQCIIYKGSTIIAEMNDNSTLGQSLNGKGALAIRVHPEVDYAFITALMIIHSEMKMAQKTAANSAAAAGAAAAATAAATAAAS